MFRNAQRDPLAVPEPVQRASVGPTRRTAAGPPRGPFHPEGFDLSNSSFDLEDREAEDELHRRHQERGGEGNPDPREFYTGGYHRTLTREARTFLADQNTEDASELLYRAARHAATQTSTWSAHASHKATQAFVAQVAELIPNRSSKVAAARPSQIEDFDDQLLY